MSFFKSFLMKRLLKSKMKDLPEAEQEKMLNIIEKNPNFFQNIATEVQMTMKEGKDQMTATMEVMRKHQEELKKIMN